MTKILIVRLKRMQHWEGSREHTHRPHSTSPWTASRKRRKRSTSYRWFGEQYTELNKLSSRRRRSWKSWGRNALSTPFMTFLRWEPVFLLVNSADLVGIPCINGNSYPSKWYSIMALIPLNDSPYKFRTRKYLPPMRLRKTSSWIKFRMVLL